MISIKLETGPAPKCKYMIVSCRKTLSTPSSPLLLEGHSLEQVEMFRNLYHMISLGVNVFNQSAVRLGISLAFSTEDSKTMLQYCSIYFNSTSPLLGPISIMPEPSGPLT